MNAFVTGMYSAAKTENENIIVSISPMADIETDMNTHFADVKLWSKDSGYCDWIIPQVYYGMKNETMPYKKVVNKWCKLVTKENVKLIIGLASYKCVEEDLHAGSGKSEWQNDEGILKKQLQYLRKRIVMVPLFLKNGKISWKK